MSAAVRIAELQPADFPDWLPLWDGNNQGQKNEAVTTETWARLTGADWQVYGLGAWIIPSPPRGEGQGEGAILAGILHYVIHPTTGNVKQVCYMQDLYVDPALRRQGIARALLDELARKGRREDWARIYWLAEESNEAAQTLYKTLGVKLDFSLHVLPL